MSKFVMVDTISMFRMRYVVEVPDDVGEEMYFKDGTRSFPCTPEEYAKDTVTCGDVREFSQEHLDEVISSCREVTKEEAVAQWRQDNSSFSSWSDDFITKSAITEVDFSINEYYEEEERRWHQSGE